MIELKKVLLAAVVAVCFPVLVDAQEPSEAPAKLPLNSPGYSYATPAPVMTIPQMRARFAAEQRMLRMEWNEWIGYSPLRPNMNASYMSNGLQRYYIPSRGVIVSTGSARSWYW